MAEEKNANQHEECILLQQQPFPEQAENTTDFIETDKEQNKQTILASPRKDRRQKYEQLPTKLLHDCDEVDICQYIVQLTIQFGDDKFYIGTGTIISIVQNALYILTCAHNLVTFHPFQNYDGTYHANSIWVKFQNEQISASKIFVYPKYCKQHRLGNDIGVIECKMNKCFMFYHIFPTLRSLESSSIWNTKQQFTSSAEWKVNVVDTTSLSMWMIKNAAVAVYNAAMNKNEDDANGLDKAAACALYQGGVYGYPGEKNGEFWGMNGDLNVLENECLISYDIDTTGGQSGGPILVDGQVVGVHTNGDYLGVKENLGAMLTQDKIEWIHELMARDNYKYKK